MPRVRFDGPGHVLDAFGKKVPAGKEAVFSDAETRSLRSQPYIQIAVDGRVLPPLPPIKVDVARPSRFASRRQWATYAENNGVEITDDMPRDEIIAAVDKPEAEAGEGHSTTQVDLGKPHEKES